MGALESERMRTNTQSLVAGKQEQTHPTSKSINGFQTGNSCWVKSVDLQQLRQRMTGFLFFWHIVKELYDVMQKL